MLLSLELVAFAKGKQINHPLPDQESYAVHLLVAWWRQQ
jgi:hypothetical protein